MTIMHRIVGAAIFFAACCASAPGAGPTGSPMREAFLANEEVIREAVFRRNTLSSAQRAAEKTLLGKAPGTSVRYDPISGAPRHVFNYGGPLTPARAAKAPDICRSFLTENAALYGFTAADLQEIACVRDFASRASGIRHVWFRQRVAGIPAYAGLRFNLTPRGELINAHGSAMPDLAHKVNAVAPAIPAAEAARIAALDAGVDLGPSPKVLSAAAQNPKETVIARGPLSRDVKASLVFYAMDGARSRLAWRIGSLCSLKAPFAYEYLIDAASGELLSRRPLIQAVRPVRWLAYAGQGAQPLAFRAGALEPEMLPARPAEPDLDPLGTTRRETIEENGDPAASPLGWIADGATKTAGNNVFAGAADWDAPDDLFQPEAAANPADGVREFFFPLVLEDPQQGPERFVAASVTDLFRLCNVIHDRLYSLGFDEAAGNFQQDNFGRGGAGGDAVLACAQLNFQNALIATPPDGEAPFIIMGLFPGGGAGPALDPVYDHAVVIHEYCHGLSNRLVDDLRYGQSGSFGEGTSDWFALSILSSPDDPIDGSHPMGAYCVQDLRGMRRYPYSTRLETDPLSYRHVRIDPIAENPAIPAVPNEGRPWEVHNAGQVWGSVLWEVRANYLRRYGWAAGTRRSEILVVEAMKLMPPHPSFVDARDAILLADRNVNGGADRDILWQAFAKRGLGYFASDGGSDYSVSVEEDGTDPYNPACSMRVRQEGASLAVELMDPALAGAAEASVELSAAGSGDRQALAVRRDERETVNLFRGSLDISFGVPARAGDGVLQALGLDTATALYRRAQGDLRKTTAVVRPFEVVAAADGPLPSGLARLRAAADIDGDGKAEIAASRSAAALALYAVRGGAMEDVAPQAGLDAFPGGTAACWADYDNDGDRDLCIASMDNKLARNAGGGLFAPAPDQPSLHNLPDAGNLMDPPYGTAAAWGDYDGDGALDLCIGFNSTTRLYRNDGAGGFEDVSGEAFTGDPPDSRYTVSWTDFNDDGFPDLCTGTMLMENNGDGTFARPVPLCTLPGVPQPCTVADVCWGDFDNDGHMDALAGTAADGTQLMRYDPEDGFDGGFVNVTAGSGLRTTGTGLGAVSVDYDNDGDLDAFALVDGALTLYDNNGRGGFTAAELGPALDPGVGEPESLALADVAGNVMPELVCVGSSGVRAYAFPPNDNRFLCVRPVIRLPNGSARDAIGAKVQADPDNDGDFSSGTILTRQIDGFGQNQPVAHFGVGAARLVSVRVIFPDGRDIVRRDVAAGGAGVVEIDDLRAEHHDTDIVVVLDRSNSMNLPCLDGRTPKIDAVKSAADLFIDLIEPDDNHRVSIVKFGDRVEPFDPPITLQDLITPRLGLLHQRISTIATGGDVGLGTCYGLALDEALAQLEGIRAPNPRRIVHLFTDGNENRNPTARDVYPDLVDAGVEIHATGFGADISPGILDEMATASGGTYAQVELDPAALQKRFIDVARGAMRMDIALDPAYTISATAAAKASVPMDASARALKFIVTWASRSARLARLGVISPNGCALTPGMPGVRESAGLGYTILHVDLDACARVRAEGTWTIAVSAGPKFPGGNQVVDLVVLADTGVDLYADAVADGKVGGKVRLGCVMEANGRPMTGVAVAAYWSQPPPLKGAPPSPTKVALYDDGLHGDGRAKDGLYGAFLYPKTAGCHRFHFVAEGTMPGTGTTIIRPRREALASCTIR